MEKRLANWLALRYYVLPSNLPKEKMVGRVVTADAVISLISTEILEAIATTNDVRSQRHVLHMRPGQIAFAERGSSRSGGSRGALLPRTVPRIADYFIFPDRRNS